MVVCLVPFEVRRWSLRQVVWSVWDVACNPPRTAGTCSRAQMMPYLASSFSSRWLKASQGQMTVMSARKDKDMRWFRPLQVIETGMKCINGNSPVPKPSIPGISSPNLQRKHNYSIYHNLPRLSQQEHVQTENINFCPPTGDLESLHLNTTSWRILLNQDQCAANQDLNPKKIMWYLRNVMTVWCVLNVYKKHHMFLNGTAWGYQMNFSVNWQ